MIIYFADRQQNVMGQASTGLPQGLIIVDDTKTEDIETGVASFEVVINYKAADRLDLEQMTEAGNYVFRSSGNDAECYTIIDAETDTKAKERRLYCEDAGLDLLNIICDEFEANEAHNIAWYIEQFAGGSGFEVGTNEIPDKTRTLGWDGEQTGTERIRSVAKQFDNAEVSYRFTIENMKITHRYIDIWEKRGVDIQQQLRLDRDIDNIIVKRSVANLITGVFATGETLEGEDESLDLVGYSYDDGDIYLDSGTGILYSRSGHGRWARPDDGNIVGRFNYETGSQSELCNRAVSHLKRYSDVEVNYEVDIVRGLENTLIGDRINIVDDAGEVYISGRILKLDTSITRDEKAATLGEYLIKSSGISDQILDLANSIQQTVNGVTNSINVISETLDTMFTLEVESTMGLRIANLKAHLYNGNKEVTQEHSPALFKWIRRTEDGEHLISRGYTLDIDLEEIGYAGTILCRFIRPVLIDWTDHLGNNITDENGDNIQFSFAGKYSEPVRRRARMLKALTRASNENEVGYPILAREVNLYERDGFQKKIDPIVQHFWTDRDGAHVTTVEQDEFINNPAGGNALLTSQGMAIRDGLDEVATFTENNITLGKRSDNASIEFLDNTSNLTVSDILLPLDDPDIEGYTRATQINANTAGDNGNKAILLNSQSGQQKALANVRTGNEAKFLAYTEEDTYTNSYASVSSYSSDGDKTSTFMLDSNTSKAGVGVQGEATSDGSANVSIYSSSDYGNGEINFSSDYVYSDVPITVISDRRLKDHIGYLGEDAVEFCRNLKPALYYKDGKEHTGFYAQDVQLANKWQAEMTPEHNGVLGLSYTDLIAPLVAYCQSLEERIKELEGK